MINKQEIEHLAKLARIEIRPEEIESMTAEIDSILVYVGQIKNITGDAEKVIPKIRNIMREDVVTNTNGQYTEKLLDNEPSREGNYLKVKKIL